LDGVITTQPQLLSVALVPGDVIYTPDWVAADMVRYFNPDGKILEPSCGDGVFLKYLQGDIDWCEIEKGRDFFSWHTPVDWVFGNPPYSIFSSWMLHSFEIAQNICYLIPLNKPFNSGKMMREWKAYGGIVAIRYYANGAELGFPIGFAIGAVWFQKNYTGKTDITIAELV
jgi:hypothetical protein